MATGAGSESERDVIVGVIGILGLIWITLALLFSVIRILPATETHKSALRRR